MKSIINLRNAFYVFIFIFIAIPSISNAQYWMSKFGYLGNYYLIRDSTDVFFSNDTSRISNKELGFKQYQRWKTFMEPRVNQDGSLSTYHQSLAQEYENILLTDDDRIPGQWNSLGPNTGTSGILAEMGIVTSLLVEDDQNIYAGTGASGLFVTHDGGANWTSLTDKYLITGIESIIKVNPDTIYIATGFDTWGKVYSKGVLRSCNNGFSWNNTKLTSDYVEGRPFTVKGMVMDPDNTQLLCALVQEEYRKSIRIAKTIDGGEHWNNKFIEVTPQGESGRDLRKIEYDPFNSNRIMASGRFLIVSDDDGENWTDITDSIPYNDGQTIYTIERITAAFHPTRNGRILLMLKKYIGEYTNSVVEFYLSDDEGDNFEKIPYGEMTDPPTPGSFTEDKFELEWSKAHYDEFYYAGMGIGKSRIYENGQIKEIYNMDIPSGYHKDIRFFQTMSVQGYGSNGESRYLDVIYHGNDGGITKGIESSESGIQWFDITGNGLNITQYYGLAITEDDKNFYLGGTQDGNLFLHDSYQWYNRANIGDAGEAVIDYDDPRKIYMVSFGTEYYLNQSSDHGITWLPSVTILPFDARRNDAPLEISYLNSGTLFIGGKQIFKSIDYGVTFNQISHFSDSKDFFKSIRVGPNSDDYVIAGRSNPYWRTPDPQEKLNRLLLTVDGFETYEDLTPPHGSDFSLHDVGIFDIAIQPDHPSNFYLALDRFEADKKVFKGIRTGYGQVAWTNMSTGLPNLPVNCIEIYKGSEDDEMFAGTDCGVYYFNKNIGHWTKYGSGMPVCPVSDIEINYKTKQLIVSTFGRGMYVAELCEIAPSDLDIYIDDAQVWEGYKRIPASIILLPGGNLTIKGEISLKFNKQILVHKSAILNIDGGTVTSECPSQTWGGIRILGTATEGQNLVHQGVVFLKNDAKIINAEIGVHCFNAEEGNKTSVYTGGGILMANNSTFRNNRTAVAFERYTHESSISFFKNCLFETVDAPPSGSYRCFVKINEVKGGLNFGNCTFINNQPLSPNPDLITKTGIDSYNSHFVVDWNCTTPPCADINRSKFENLIYGIYAISLPGTRMFKVVNSTFTNNDCGIYALNTDNIDVRDNIFYLKKVGDRNTGLYLDHCNGYIVEENVFRLSGDDNNETTRGIYVNESGPFDNTIYRNNFYNLNYGIFTEGINKSSTGQGLQIKCNTFINTVMDISVWPDYLSIVNGIAKDQGIASPKFCEQLAGNIFTQDMTINQYHFFNGPSERINYHYLSTDQTMRPRNVVRVDVEDENPLFGGECCPQNLYGGGGTASIDQQSLEYKAEYLFSKTELDSLIDQGDTDEKLFSLSTALPDEGIALTSDLLQTSPYVSDTVIKKSIEREDVLTNSMIRDVMVANPNTAKSNDLMNHLNTRLNPLPQYMIDEIMEGQFVHSERELKQAIGNLSKRAYVYEINKQLASLLSDSLISEVDSLHKLLNADGEFNSLLKKSWVYFENGDTLTALAYFNELDSLNLVEIQTSELDAQYEFMDWMTAHPVFDSSQVVTLEAYLNSPSHKISSSVLGMLVAHGASNYQEPYSVIDLNKASDPIKTEKKRIVESYLIVTPNPAKNYITIKYAGENETFSLLIFNEVGRLLLKQAVNKQRDEVTINTINFKPGIYLLMLKPDAGSCMATKFIISK